MSIIDENRNQPFEIFEKENKPKRTIFEKIDLLFTDVETEGKNLEAGFNPKYFLDALRAIDDPEVFIDFGSSISPCIIRPTEENGDYIYMVLPIRMKE